MVKNQKKIAIFSFIMSVVFLLTTTFAYFSTLFISGVFDLETGDLDFSATLWQAHDFNLDGTPDTVNTYNGLDITTSETGELSYTATGIPLTIDETTDAQYNEVEVFDVTEIIILRILSKCNVDGTFSITLYDQTTVVPITTAASSASLVASVIANAYSSNANWTVTVVSSTYVYFTAKKTGYGSGALSVDPNGTGINFSDLYFGNVNQVLIPGRKIRFRLIVDNNSATNVLLKIGFLSFTANEIYGYLGDVPFLVEARKLFALMNASYTIYETAVVDETTIYSERVSGSIANSYLGDINGVTPSYVTGNPPDPMVNNILFGRKERIVLDVTLGCVTLEEIQSPDYLNVTLTEEDILKIQTMTTNANLTYLRMPKIRIRIEQVAAEINR